MSKRSTRSAMVLASLTLATGFARAAGDDPPSPPAQDEAGAAAATEPEVSFAREIYPLLQRHCIGCHQPAKAGGGVILIDHAAILAGDRDGEALLVPGDPEASLLLDSVSPFEDLPPDMPKDKPALSDADRDLLRRWIQAGALDDGAGDKTTVDAEHPPSYVQAPVIPAIDWSPDGSVLAVSGHHEILLYSADGTLRTRLIGMSERIQSLAFSPDGTRLAMAGGSPARFGEVQIWSLDPPELKLSSTFGHDVLFGISWSVDATRVAFGCTDTVRVIEIAGGAQVLFQGAHEDWVLDTVFSTDDSHLVTVSRDQSMKLIHVPEEQFIDNITSITPGALKGGIQSVARHPTEDQLLVGGADGEPKIFRMYREKKRVIGDDYNLIRALPAMEGRVFEVAYSSDGSLCAAAASNGGAGSVRLYQVGDGGVRWSHDWPSGAYALCFDPSNSRLAVAGFEGIVRVYSVADGQLQHEFLVNPDVSAAEPAETDATEAPADPGTRNTSAGADR